MSSKYAVAIEDSQERGIVRAAGSLKLVTLAVKEGLAEIEGREGIFATRFVEVDGSDVAGTEKRQVLELTAEADIVATVLRKRLAAEKKAEGDQPGVRIPEQELPEGAAL